MEEEKQARQKEQGVEIAFSEKTTEPEEQEEASKCDQNRDFQREKQG